MDIISLEQKDCLFWLGRYTERVYTTTLLFAEYYDRLIEGGDEGIRDFCKRLEIPDIYSVNDNFAKEYCFDESNPDSIASNLNRGYDNAIILRETIGSSSLSYIQLALYEMKKAANSSAPLLSMQKVCDNILAFWGMIDDSVEASDTVRDLIKSGRRIERVDLYARMHMPSASLRKAIRRLTTYRLVRSGLGCNENRVKRLDVLAAGKYPNYSAIVYEVEHIFAQE